MNAGTAANQSDLTFVLVHGACHGAWCWTRVEDGLKSRGWSVSALELPLTSLVEDAHFAREAIDEIRSRGERVVVVGHSYGGVVISEAGHAANALVYVAGTMPDANESATALIPRLAPPELAAAVVVSEDGLDASIHPGRATAAFYNRCSLGDARWAIERLRPMRLLTLQQPIGQPAWKSVDASYIVCSDDRAMRPDYQMECARVLGNFVVLDSDHSPFICCVDELVERLERVALGATERPASVRLSGVEAGLRDVPKVAM